MWNEVEDTRSVEESIALTRRREPMIILSASGMATGGRVLHHLLQLAPDARNTIMFVGYQAAGTRGHALVNGAKWVRVYGEDVPLNAEVVHLDAMSAHADCEELLGWLGSCPESPRHTWVVHGEPETAAAFADAIAADLGWSTHVPAYGERIVL
jgi:metallo-beta-lactamase family protein